MRSNDTFEHELMTMWIDSIDIGFCVLDANGVAIVLNQPACTKLGVDARAVINQPASLLFRGAEDPAAVERWLNSEDVGAEHCMTRADASGALKLLLKKQPLQHGSGENFQVISISDVTSLLAAQHALELRTRVELEHRQWQAVNAGVVISDALQPDMPIVYVNPEFERMSGYRAEEILGKNCRFLQGGQRDQPALQPIRDAIRAGTSGYAVLRNFRKDGSPFDNELFISPVRNAEGKVIQFVGIQHLRADDGTRRSAM